MKSASSLSTQSEKKKTSRVIDFQSLMDGLKLPFLGNKVKSNKFTLLNFLPATIYSFFRNISCFWFLLITLFDIIINPNQFNGTHYMVIAFGLLFAIKLFQNFCIFIQGLQNDSNINSRAFWKLKNNEFIQTKSQDIKVGDIVLVKNLEYVPADILIFSSDNEKKIYISEKNITGIKQLAQKKTIKGLSVFSNFFQLEGSLKKIENIKVPQPSESLEKFKASLKIKGNPKAFNAGIESYVMRESRLVGNEWVIGIVIYAGMETKYWLNSHKGSSSNMSKLEILINKIQIVNFVIIFLLTLISCLVYSLNSDFLDRDTGLKTSIYYVILYCNFIPISLFFCLKLSKLLQTVLISLKNHKISIKNSDIMETLGSVEYVLADKSLIVTEKIEFLAICIVDRNIYLNETDQFELEETKRIKYENYNFLKSNTSRLRFSDDNLSCFDLFEQVQTNFISDELWKFILCLCFFSKSKHNVPEKFAGEDEKVFTKFLYDLGIKSVQRMDKSYVINFKEKEYEFEVLGEIVKKPIFNISEIVVKDPDNNNILLFAKGNPDVIKNLLEDQNDIGFVETICSQEGLKNILFAYKTLDLEELENFVFELSHAKFSQMNKQAKIVDVFEKYGENLKYLGFVGLDYLISKENKQTIRNLNSSGIKTWIVSGENEENSTVACEASEIFEKSSKLVSLVGLDKPDQCLFTMKKILEGEISNKSTTKKLDDKSCEENKILPQSIPYTEMNHIAQSLESEDGLKNEDTYNKENSKTFKLSRKQSYKYKKTKEASLENSFIGLFSFFSKKSLIKSLKPVEKEYINYSLSIDSISFDSAMSSYSHRKLFAILIFSAKAVCFHSMTPKRKVDLVKFLKSNLSSNPVVIVAANQISDPGMLKTADVSVSLKNSKKSDHFTPDVRISAFSDLTELILFHGHYSSVRLSKIVMLSVLKECMVCVLLFLYQIQADFSGTNLIDFDLLVMFEMFISIVPILIIGIFEKDAIESTIIESYKIYPIGFSNALLSKGRFIFHYLLGTTQGAILYVFIVYGLGCIANSSGYTEDFEVKGIASYILICVCLLTNAFMLSKKVYIKTILYTIVTIVFTVMSVFMIYNNTLTSYSISQTMILNQTSFWILITTLPLVLGAFCYFLEEVSCKYLENYEETRLKVYEKNRKEFFKDNKDQKKENIWDEFKIGFPNIKFISSLKETEYQEYLNEFFKKNIKILIGVIFLYYIIYTVLLFSNLMHSMEDNKYSLIPLSIIFMLKVISFTNLIYLKNLKILCFVFFIGLLIVKSILHDKYTALFYPLLELFISLSTIFSFTGCFLKTLIVLIVSLIFIVVQEYDKNDSDSILIILFYDILNLGILSICVYIAYVHDLNQRNQFIILQKNEIQHAKVNKILSYFLPEFVKKRVKDGVRYIAEDKGTVTVIFIDICDFDLITDEYPPQALTSFLDDLFRKLDGICESLGVTKIETVGKTYLACAGLEDSEIDIDPNIAHVPHARRALEMGLSVLKEAGKITLRNGNPLRFKIGINSGPVTAGVVGYHKPQFSLVGDTVNTASRMSSTLKEYNAIQISQETYNLLDSKQGFIFSPRHPEVKGKGIMDTFIAEAGFGINNENNFLSKSSFTTPDRINTNNSLNFISTPSRRSSFALYSEFEKNNLASLLVIKKPLNSLKNILMSSFEPMSVEENEFQKSLTENNSKIQFAGFFINMISNGILLILETIQVILKSKYANLGRAIILVIEEIFTFILLYYTEVHKNKNYFKYLLCMLYSTEILLFFIVDIKGSSNEFINVMYCAYRFLQINYCTSLTFSRLLLVNFVTVFIWLLSIFLLYSAPEVVFSSCFFIAYIIATSYNIESNLRDNYLLKKFALEEIQKTEHLLVQMMPAHVLKNLEEEIIRTDRIIQVSILFADIVGFTAWSSCRNPQEVVEMLSGLFTKFDQMCLEFDIYKVHTIGDCYVAMGYTGNGLRNCAKEALNLVKFAFSLIKVIDEYNVKYKCHLGMRIGVHTGELIGAITGTNIVRYDIYGRDVMIANKIESNGQQGKVCVSESTKSLLEDYLESDVKLEFSFHKELNISSKTLNTYWVHDL
jgi:magnesium-transporting ATPase (P-type)/class 3 adenylate cyclase